ncbi:hypothetical protein AGMMS49982_19060 [Bacteroidia bacterium]|nr:hypothetical protein AGMMS49982_19060 [Bacteroidia bacterium]
MSNKTTPRVEFNDFIHAIGSEIEQAQVKTVSAANVQMLLHYWKVGNFILHSQQQLGWGSKVVDNISNAIREKYPQKKGYSPRNLKYMCKFAALYPLEVLNQMLVANKELETPTVRKVLDVAKALNALEIAQQSAAQLQAIDTKEDIITQEPLAQLQVSDTKENIIVQEAPAQLQAIDTKEDIIVQEAPAQLQTSDTEGNIIVQEPPAQLQLTHTENNIITQEPPAQLYKVSDVLVEIMQEPLAQIESTFAKSPIAHINWASHMILMNKSLPLGIRYWYMREAVECGWSSNVLDIQIDSGLFQRQMKARKINNFTKTLPDAQSDLANYLFKDPYLLDTMDIKDKADERDIEKQLVEHVSKYLVEMGTGFAFVARQKHFQVGDKDYYTDLILYNIKLHAYVVVELKATPFQPEYMGQLNFYLNVVNDQLKGEHDNKTIGLLLCRGKDELTAQYALEGYSQPMGVSDYQLSKAIPEELKSALPSIEEVEQELSQMLEQKTKL